MKNAIYIIFYLILFISCSKKNKNDFEINSSYLTDLNDNQIDLDSYHGNVLFLNLWATWCKPCIVEFEDIMNSKKIFEKDSIKFVAISNENINTIKSFVQKNKYDIEFLKLEGDYSYFDAYGLPTTIIFDKSGKEIFRTSGMKKNQFTSTSFIRKIKKLL
tara:strand:+ start:4647 stop:5126 length:480 start_codon:yes stop_codon:yes gene_type:complete